jgi:hypothetical protein
MATQNAPSKNEPVKNGPKPVSAAPAPIAAVAEPAAKGVPGRKPRMSKEDKRSAAQPFLEQLADIERKRHELTLEQTRILTSLRDIVKNGLFTVNGKLMSIRQKTITGADGKELTTLSLTDRTAEF